MVIDQPKRKPTATAALHRISPGDSSSQQRTVEQYLNSFQEIFERWTILCHVYWKKKSIQNGKWILFEYFSYLRNTESSAHLILLFASFIDIEKALIAFSSEKKKYFA